MTAFLPLVLMPILGLDKGKDMSEMYWKDCVMQLFIILCLSITIEEINLHKRVAYWLLRLSGPSPASVLYGFMATSYYLAYYLPDYTVVNLMVPLATAACNALEASKANSRDTVSKAEKPTGSGAAKSGRSAASNKSVSEKPNSKSEAATQSGSSRRKKGGAEVETVISVGSGVPIDPDDTEIGLRKALILACAHAALIGGTALLTAATPSLIVSNIINDATVTPPRDPRKPDEPTFPIFDPLARMSYMVWAAFAMPQSILFLVVSYLTLAARGLNIHPLYMLLPCAIAPSLAFATPWGNAPMAVVYESGVLEAGEIVLTGAIVSIVCVALTLLNINTWGYWMLALHEDMHWHPEAVPKATTTVLITTTMTVTNMTSAAPLS
ncbi:unnamed protein product, partial [Mesorhabditis spiculigera]